MGWIRSLRKGSKALRDKSARNEEIDEELEAFIGESVSEKMRGGMSLKDAVKAAHAEAGTAATVREKVWSAGWESRLDRLWGDLTYSLRRLSRAPALVFTVVLSIGLGIAANGTIFSIISTFLLQPPPIGDPSRLIAITRTHDHELCCNYFPKPVYQDLRAQSQSFSDMAAYYDVLPASIGANGEAKREWGQAVTANYFDVTQLQMVAGRGFQANEEHAPAIVLGYRLWQRQFAGDAAIVGKVIDVSGHPYTVVGVARAGFRGLEQVLDPQFWVPLGDLPELTPNAPSPDSRENQWLHIAARLKPEVTQQQAAQELGVIAQRFAQAYPATDKDNGFHMGPVGSIPERDKKSIEMFLLGISIVALLVLVIACANVANLLLAYGAQRQREMAVRLALGATHAQLLRQMLLESVLLALGGGVVGVLLSLWATYGLSSFKLAAPVATDISVHVDWHVLLYTFALSVMAGLLCGFVPAWTASRPIVSNALKGETSLSRPGRRLSLRSILVVTQVMLSLVLLCGAGLFLRSLESAAKMDVGFRSRGVVMMAVDPQLNRYTPERSVQMLQDVRERIAHLPGVISATTTDGVPLSGGHRSDGFVVPGYPPPQGFNSVELYMAGPHYFETLGIPRIAGRDLGDENPMATRAAIVNEEFVRRYFHGDNPIGHTVNGGGVSYQIVGVAKDMKARTLGEQQRPVLYRAISQNIASDPQDGYHIMAHYDGDPATLIKAMQDQIRSVDPALAIFDVQTMEEHMRDALMLPRLVSTLFTVFGVSGLLLAVIGLYSVMSYSVSQRTKEIGVRMALGAKATEVQRMIVRGGMRLALVSVALGLPLALFAAKLTTSLLYGIKPRDVVTFTLVPLLLVAVSLIACWIPSRRASRVDPIVALRVD
ncbi:MAG: ABC transporter permease [Acidobacteria bacterium]|nr:ABC transporter permease [Acidobacteriota bacterium]